MTFPELYKLDTPSVSLLNYGEKTPQKGVAVFQSLVLKIVQYFGGNWTNEQILDCGKVCFDEWYYLTFAELAHFSQKVKMGAFKQPDKPLLYGPITPANVLEWFCIYTDENRDQRAQHFGIGDKSNNSKWLPPAEPVSEEAIQNFQQKLAELEQQVTEEKRIEDDEKMQKRIDDIAKFQKLMQQSQEARANKSKGKIERDQISDNYINDIP